ncbi:MAG: VOC family protein [Actinomycetes bacterium]
MTIDTAKRPSLTGIKLGADPQAWAAAGFTISGHALAVGGVTIEFTAPLGGIECLVFDHLPEGVTDIDGLPAEVGPAIGDTDHENGVYSIDQVVIATPEFDRTAQIMRDMGLGFTREAVRETEDGTEVRQGFVRSGDAVLEVVHADNVTGEHAHGWGLGFITADLDKAIRDLEGLIGPPREAIQPGRRIATIRRDANLGIPVVLMDPEQAETDEGADKP